MSKGSVLEDYKAELKVALVWKASGVTEVRAGTAGEHLAAGRDYVPINEYIAKWQAGIDAMEAGADQSIYNY
jgi:hypothetical protein